MTKPKPLKRELHDLSRALRSMREREEERAQYITQNISDGYVEGWPAALSQLREYLAFSGWRVGRVRIVRLVPVDERGAR